MPELKVNKEPTVVSIDELARVCQQYDAEVLEDLEGSLLSEPPGYSILCKVKDLITGVEK